MTKKTKRQKKQAEQTRSFGWIPLWGWVLIFLVPLALSEYMFYVAGRTASLVLFPLAWIGFWYVMMWRSGWSILKKNDKDRS
jgi:hypothetical protein